MVSERQYRFAQSVLKESLIGPSYKSTRQRKDYSTNTKKRVRRNSDDEPVDLEYEEI